MEQVINYKTITWVSIMSGLGFIRGIQYYQHAYTRGLPVEQTIYTSMIPYGAYGIILYVNPVIFPWIFIKELYRFEVYIRNLKDEKNTDFYNDIL